MIYVIVVTYNAEKWIKTCFENFSNLFPELKIIVVDNNSSDNTIDILKKEYPFFIIIKNKINAGFGQANNIGMSLALRENADHVFLLNQDASITQSDILRLADVQKQFPEFFIISPVHLDGTGQELDCGFASYCAPDNCPGLYRDAIFGSMNEIYASSMGCAAGWLLSKNCLEVIGGFNPVFFHYGEDDEYRNRVFYHGYKLGVVPGTFLYHARENRDDSKNVSNTNSLFLDTLKMMTDLNNTISDSSYFAHLAWQFIKNFMLFRFNKCLQIVCTYIRLHRMRKLINTNREKVKHVGPNFLA